MLRAEDPAEARELLLLEGLYAKQLDPATEEDPITWAAKRSTKEKLAAATPDQASFPSEPTRHLFPATLLAQPHVEGKAGLAEDGRFSFRSVDPSRSFALARDELEEVSLRGWFRKTLRLTHLDGRQWELHLGHLFTPTAARNALQQFNPKGPARR